MSLPLMEHDATGAVRYLIRNDGSAEVGLFVDRAVRQVPIVEQPVVSLHRGPWFSGWVACLDCCNGWVAIAPLDDGPWRKLATVLLEVLPEKEQEIQAKMRGARRTIMSRGGRGLECLACGSSNSAPVRQAWCSSCGQEQLVVQPEGAPVEGCECDSCHAMAVLVEDAA